MQRPTLSLLEAEKSVDKDPSGLLFVLADNLLLLLLLLFTEVSSFGLQFAGILPSNKLVDGKSRDIHRYSVRGIRRKNT